MDEAQTARPAILEPSAVVSEDWAADERLTRFHFALMLLVYSIYGYQVCPFLEQLHPVQLIAPAAIMLAMQYLVRAGIKRWCRTLPLHTKVRALFWGDFSLFVFSGVALAAFNFIVFGFPPVSGIKVLFAFATIGFYVSLDLAFERELQLGKELRLTGQAFPIGPRFSPYQFKFVLFSTINLIVLSSTCILIIYKDLLWTAEANPDPYTAQILIMAEVFYAVGVLAAYIIRVIRQYSRNVNARIDAENQALRKVQDGDLDAQAAVISNDEFGHMAQLTNQMIQRLKSSIDEIERTQNVTIMSLISLAAKRDNETGMHIRRTQTYIAVLADALRKFESYRDVISEEMIDLLFKSAPLHDIGKVGVADAILQKPGKLDDDEFEIMKTHAQIGADALEDAEQMLGGSSFLSLAKEIAATHHEKWDGSGYPKGLKGREIPLSGRLMAVADVYDALRSKRVYKPGFSHSKSAAIIVKDRGTHFDPDIVDAFVMVQGVFEKISQQLCDDRLPQDPDETSFELSGIKTVNSVSHVCYR